VGTSDQPKQPTDFTNALTATALGVAQVNVQQIPPNQVRFWTDRVGPQGTSSRFSYAQTIQTGYDVWVVQLTVPADRAGRETEQLFTTVAQGFRP